MKRVRLIEQYRFSDAISLLIYTFELETSIDMGILEQLEDLTEEYTALIKEYIDEIG